MKLPILMSTHYLLHQSHTLEELAAKVLHQKCLFTRRNVRVELDDQELYLHGEVQSFYEKQQAQEALRTLEGVCRIRNKLHVRETV